MTKIISQNKKAYFNYDIIKEYEAGICLLGNEVKALRLGKVDIQNSYIEIDKNYEVYIFNINIPSIKNTINSKVSSNERKIKLLLNKQEINQLFGAVKLKGMTIIPLSIYFNNRNFVKLKIAMAKGKKNYDKRASIKEKDIKRETMFIKKYNGKF